VLLGVGTKQFCHRTKHSTTFLVVVQVHLNEESCFRGYAIQGYLVIENGFLNNAARILENCQGAGGRARRLAQEDDDDVRGHCQVFCVRSEEVYDGRILH